MYALDPNTLICFFKGMGNVAAHLLSKTPAGSRSRLSCCMRLKRGSPNPTNRKNAVPNSNNCLML